MATMAIRKGYTDPMPDNLQQAALLAEVLRLQRWAGGETVEAARIYGLAHGFESVIDSELESRGISAETQRKVEVMLDDVDAGRQPAGGRAIKDRLHRDGIRETDASRVMELCLLQGRFTDTISNVAGGEGSVFSSIDRLRLPEHDWLGAMHYMELVDCTDGGHTRMHGVFAPAIPRVGETIQPERGDPMVVVAVKHTIDKCGEREGVPIHHLAPCVCLVPAEDQDDD